jgi:hypothetical protein
MYLCPTATSGSFSTLPALLKVIKAKFAQNLEEETDQEAVVGVAC